MKTRKLNSSGLGGRHQRQSWTAAPLLIGATLLIAYLKLHDKVSTSFSTTYFEQGRDILGFLGCSSPQPHFPFEDLQKILISVPDPKKAREWNLHYTSEPHNLGQGEPHAIWTQQKWRDFGVENTSVDYFPVPIPLPTPRNQRIALLQRDAKGKEVSELYVARLMEASTYVNPISGKIVTTPQFAAQAPSGNVTAQFVYVNFGSSSDYEDLRLANITVEGKIVILKQGGIDASVILKQDGIDESMNLTQAGIDTSRVLWEAQKRGVLGVIWYLDPQDDGLVTESHGYAPYPKGPARAPDSVLRRVAVFPRLLEPTSPIHIVLPVIPISYSEAVPLLQALNGHGPEPCDLGQRWAGGQLGYLGVQYNVGPSPAGVVINLMNDMESRNVSAIDVIGTIKGVIEDEVVILGNHRDAWAAGAGDPNSGSAALNEVIRTLGVAMKKGWKPRRTLVFASWDGHEVGVWGSKLWLNANLPWLLNTTVAYMEVEIAATGSEFYVKASPLLTDMIRDATAQVMSPNQTQRGQSVRTHNWDGRLESESGGDSTYFVMNGITSVNAGFRPSPVDPHFHWHSDFDTVEWMDNFGDPTWGYHVASAQIWAIAAARLVEQPVHPFNIGAYARALHQFLDDVKSKAGYPLGESEPYPCSLRLDLLGNAISHLQEVARRFDRDARALSNLLEGDGSEFEKHSRAIQVINFKYRNFERHFVYENDHGRIHLVFPPSTYRKNLPAFPLLTGSVEEQKWCEAEVSVFPTQSESALCLRII